jgi:hypothetical protein
MQPLQRPRCPLGKAFRRLAAQFGTVGPATKERITGALLTSPGMQTKRPSDADLDEFAALDVQSAAEIQGRFVPNFFFGCEADDPMNAVAFDRRLWPYNARINLMYGSDIAHFDVPVMAEVLHEAWERVKSGVMTPEQFRDFVFINPARFYTETNPDFFAETIVAREVGRLTSPPEVGQ